MYHSLNELKRSKAITNVIILHKYIYIIFDRNDARFLNLSLLMCKKKTLLAHAIKQNQECYFEHKDIFGKQ